MIYTKNELLALSNGVENFFNQIKDEKLISESSVATNLSRLLLVTKKTLGYLKDMDENSYEYSQKLDTVNKCIKESSKHLSTLISFLSKEINKYDFIKESFKLDFNESISLSKVFNKQNFLAEFLIKIDDGLANSKDDSIEMDRLKKELKIYCDDVKEVFNCGFNNRQDSFKEIAEKYNDDTNVDFVSALYDVYALAKTKGCEDIFETINNTPTTNSKTALILKITKEVGVYKEVNFMIDNKIYKNSFDSQTKLWDSKDLPLLTEFLQTLEKDTLLKNINEGDQEAIEDVVELNKLRTVYNQNYLPKEILKEVANSINSKEIKNHLESLIEKDTVSSLKTNRSRV